MATNEEIAAFRLTIDEPGTEFYTDLLLGDRMDAAETLESLAASIWLEKAARYGRLVDMQEGTSSRKLSQLQASALKMAAAFGGGSDASGGGSTRRPTVTRAIERI